MKRVIAITMTSVLLMVLGGCQNDLATKSDASASGGKPSVERPVTPTTEKEAQPSMVGKILKFEEKTIQILSGDIIENYPYDRSLQQSLYLGEIVELIQDGQKNKLKPYLQKDFSTKYTTMGEAIQTITGKLTSEKDGHIKLENGAKKITVAVDKKTGIPIGSDITIEYFERGKILWSTGIYKESSIKKLTVEAVHRANDGEMMLNLTDKSGKKYKSGTAGASLEVNLTEIKVGDKLLLYCEETHKGQITELSTVRIVKP